MQTTIDDYLVDKASGNVGRFLAWKDLRSGLLPSSDLKVRRVFTVNMLAKAEQLKTGYTTAFMMCVRDNEDGTYTVFDGNHRYHAIGHWIKKGKELPNNPYSPEFQIPCLVYKRSLPNEQAMHYATVINDMQRYSRGGSTLDFLRFLKNLRAQEEKTTG